MKGTNNIDNKGRKLISKILYADMGMSFELWWHFSSGEKVLIDKFTDQQQYTEAFQKYQAIHNNLPLKMPMQAIKRTA